MFVLYAQLLAFKRENLYTGVLFLIVSATLIVCIVFKKKAGMLDLNMQAYFGKTLKAYFILFVSFFPRVYNKFNSRF